MSPAAERALVARSAALDALPASLRHEPAFSWTWQAAFTAGLRAQSPDGVLDHLGYLQDELRRAREAAAILRRELDELVAVAEAEASDASDAGETYAANVAAGLLGRLLALRAPS